jgi:hypothetical protein
LAASTTSISRQPRITQAGSRPVFITSSTLCVRDLGARLPKNQQRGQFVPSNLEMPTVRNTYALEFHRQSALSPTLRASRLGELNPVLTRQPGDHKRAAEIVQTLRKSLKKYVDHEAALKDGDRIFGRGVGRLRGMVVPRPSVRKASRSTLVPPSCWFRPRGREFGLRARV